MRRSLLLLLFSLPACAAHDWKLIWSDEFNEAAHSPPDPAKWTYDLGAGGWGNQELETYTARSQNIAQDGKGHLVISARQEHGKFTSARIKREGKFTVQYGRIAARMKIAHGQGIWPAFWMLGSDIEKAGWPASGEIDIMENIGKEPDVVHGTVHGPGYSGSKGLSRSFTPDQGVPLSSDFHVYAVDWSRDSIKFQIDDHTYFTVTAKDLPDGARWVYDRPFFLLLNLAVGGGWPGNPDRSTHFPQKLIVDWVRVWKDVY